MARKKRRKKLRIFSFSSLFLFLFIVGIGGLGMRLYTTAKTARSQYANTGACTAKDLSGVFLPDEKIAFFLNREIPVPSDIASLNTTPDVLGASDDERWVEIDLSEQKLYAWEGDRLLLESLVSTGKWGRTPTGEFRVWTKLRYTKMSGGDQSLGTYYYLPNVPYVMFFSGPNAGASAGYSLHGTYWHNNFGTPMSHGCVNLPTPIAEKIFNWAGPVLPEGASVIHAAIDNPGLRIVIHE